MRLQALILLLLAVNAWAGDAIPTGRKIPWEPGVPGGIPYYSNVFVTLTPGAVAGNATVINNALINAPSNSVVLLSVGHFQLNASIRMSAIGGRVLRGSGTGTNAATATILSFTAGGVDGNIQMIGDLNHDIADLTEFPDFTNRVRKWTSGYTQGTTNITVDQAPTGLQKGWLLTLDQPNNNIWVRNNTGEGCGLCGRTNGTWSTEQNVVVQNIVGTTITFWPPVYATNWFDTPTMPEVWWRGTPTTRCGVENMTVSNSAGGSSYTIAMRQATYCWASNVHTYNGKVAHIHPVVSYGCEVRRCYSYGTINAASQSYGVLMEAAAGTLVTDNIFEKLTSPVVIGFSSAGNVISYNFSTNNFYSPVALYQQGMNSHAGHNYYNLIEGNWSQYWYGDAIHGSGSHNTVFRNRLTGREALNNKNTSVIQFEHTNWLNNIVGNILGDDAWHNNYESEDNLFFPETSIYRLGFPSGAGVQVNDPMVKLTLLRKGNYNTVDDAIPAGEAMGGDTYPDSYYLASKPAFFGNFAWPPYDATNPSHNSPTNIPAGFRFWVDLSGPIKGPVVLQGRQKWTGYNLFKPKQ